MTESSDESRTPANASNRQLLVNFGTSYLSLIVGLVLSLFLTPIVLRRLGTSTYGLWIVFTAIGGYVGILEVGVSTATAQMVASATALRDYQRLADILATAQAFFMVTGILAFGVTAALIPLLGTVIGTGTEQMGAARLALVLSGLLTAVTFFTAVSQCALFGGGRNDRSTYLAVVIGILTQGGQIAIVLFGGGLIGLFAVSVGGGILTFFGTRRIARRLGLFGHQRGRRSRSMLAELLRSGRRNAVVALGGTISYSLDALLIGVVLPVRQVAPYDLGLSTASFVNNGATTATNLLLPTYAHSHALNENERQFRLYSRAVLASMCIAVPLVVALFAFGQGLLHLWLGTVPPHTFQVLVAINIVLLLQLPGRQAFLHLTAIGRNKILARMALPAAIVNLALSLGATLWLGPVGPAIGSLPQVIILDFLILPAMSCRAMGASLRRYLREAMLPVAAPLVAATLAAVVLRAAVVDPPRYWIPVEAIAVTLVAWAVLLPVLIKSDPVFADLLHRGRVHLAARIRR